MVCVSFLGENMCEGKSGWCHDQQKLYTCTDQDLQSSFLLWERQKVYDSKLCHVHFSCTFDDVSLMGTHSHKVSDKTHTHTHSPSRTLTHTHTACCSFRRI